MVGVWLCCVLTRLEAFVVVSWLVCMVGPHTSIVMVSGRVETG